MATISLSWCRFAASFNLGVSSITYGIRWVSFSPKWRNRHSNRWFSSGSSRWNMASCKVGHRLVMGATLSICQFIYADLYHSWVGYRYIEYPCACNSISFSDCLALRLGRRHFWSLISHVCWRHPVRCEMALVLDRRRCRKSLVFLSYLWWRAGLWR